MLEPSGSGIPSTTMSGDVAFLYATITNHDHFLERRNVWIHSEVHSCLITDSHFDCFVTNGAEYQDGVVTWNFDSELSVGISNGTAGCSFHEDVNPGETGIIIRRNNPTGYSSVGLEWTCSEYVTDVAAEE
jgi:hypothetical protein